MDDNKQKICSKLLGKLHDVQRGIGTSDNKDNQEDKEPLFDVIDTVRDCLKAYADMVPNIEIKADNMYSAAQRGFSTATDLADYLVCKGMPFRDAHEEVGASEAFGIEQGRE